jgi:hypothetical protein
VKDTSVQASILEVNMAAAYATLVVVKVLAFQIAVLGLAYTVGSGCGGEPLPAAKAIEPNYSWCPAGFEVGAGDTCFKLPAQKMDAPILLYVHSAISQEKVLAEYKDAQAFVAKGFALVLTRGRQEACGFTREQKEALCWTLDPDNTEEAKAHAEGWDKALWQVGALLDGKTHVRYVVGLREGAALVAQIASANMIPGATYGLMTPTGPTWSFGKTQAGALAVFGQSPYQAALSQANWRYVMCPETSSLDGAVESLRDLNPAQPAKGIVLRDAKCTWSDATKK